MNILIVGGFGFLGRNIAQSLISEGHDITIIDDLSSGKEIRSKDIIFYNLSAEDKRCEEVFMESSFHTVIYLAFRGYSESEYEGKINDIRMNNAGLNNILFLCHKYNVKKVIGFTSNQSTNTLEDESYLTREYLFEEYSRIGVPVTILKLGAVYGPGQYGCDSRYIDELLRSNTIEDMEISREYIYIKDLCDAVVKVVENDTPHTLYISNGLSISNREIYSIYRKYMDQGVMEEQHNSNLQQSLFFLDWVPKTTMEEGLIKTIDWFKKSLKEDSTQDEGYKEKIKKPSLNIKINKSFEVIFLFIIFTVIHYVAQYRNGINIDFLLLFIVFTNLFFGLKEGTYALGLSVLSFVWFKFNLEGKTALTLTNDLNTILYLTMYGVISISIGYLVDELKREKKYLSDEIEFYQGEMSFLRELYNKSIEVKNNLQFNLEHYEDNFSKTYTIVDTLDKRSTIQIFDGVADIYANLFHVKNVSIYRLNLDNTWLRMTSYVGDGRHGNSINISENSFLRSVIKNNDLFMNKELNINYPTICIPIIYGGQTRAVAFLDDINFENLTERYLNSLRVVTRFISNSISIAFEYEEAIEDKRYYPNTIVMRKEWFDKLIEEKLQLKEAQSYGIVMIKINSEIKNYIGFSNKISKLIRDHDVVGEIGTGQLGIIPFMVVSQGISCIVERLSKSGIDVDVFYLGGD